jgi:hypothetical protein
VTDDTDISEENFNENRGITTTDWNKLVEKSGMNLLILLQKIILVNIMITNSQERETKPKIWLTLIAIIDN